MIYFIKLGGSLITDKSKPLHDRPDIIKNIARELGQAYKERPEDKWVIGTGAGSYGHYTVQSVKYRDNPSDPLRIAAVHASAEKLCHLVIAALIDEGIPAGIFSPFQHIHQMRSELVVNSEQLTKMLSAKIVPVTHGDIILNDSGSSLILSTEKALHGLAEHFSKDKMTIYVTSVDGVLDKDSQAIPVFDHKMSLHEHLNKDFDVTGGMSQKVQEGFTALGYSSRVYIINGLHTGNLTAALNLETVGTRLEA